jgi:hypothetical protein
MIPQRAQWRWLARTYSSTSLISDSISLSVTSCPVQRTKTYSHSKTYSHTSACSSVVLKLQLFGVIPQAITKEIIFNKLSALQSTTHMDIVRLTKVEYFTWGFQISFHKPLLLLHICRSATQNSQSFSHSLRKLQKHVLYSKFSAN